MAMTQLDGTSGQVDVNIASNSFKCVIMGFDYRCGRSFTSVKTLCSGKWVSELPQDNQDFITCSRVASQGATISDTSVFMTNVTPSVITVTLATGCTKSGNYFLDSDTYSVGAGVSAITGQLSWRSAGAVATAWVTT